VPTVELELGVDALPIVAFARMKPVLAVEPAGEADASWRQPVTVTALSSVLLVDGLGVCAAVLTTVAHANAAAINIARFIDILLARSSVQAGYPFDGSSDEAEPIDMRDKATRTNARLEPHPDSSASGVSPSTVPRQNKVH
jgi:hypothetical protein